MSSADFKERLAAMREQHEKAKERTNEFQGLPDGLYQGRLVGLKPAISKSAGNPMLQLCFVITEGELTGRKHWANQMLTNEVGIDISTRFIEAHGCEMPTIIDWEASSETDGFVFTADFLNVCSAIEAEEPIHEFTIVTKGEYTNTLYRRLVSDTVVDFSPSASEDAAPEAEPTPSDDDGDLRTRLLEFCAEQQLPDIDDSMSVEDLTKELSAYQFATEGVTVPMLSKKGIEASIAAEMIDNVIDGDAVELLMWVGLSAQIHRPTADK